MPSCRRGRVSLGSSVDRRGALRAAVAPLANYLHNPLPPGPGVCRACRGAVEAQWETCFPCKTYASLDPGKVADVIVPVAYAVSGEQHYDDLKSYKGLRPAPLAAGRLSAIAELFLLEHRSCLLSVLSGPIRHVAVVPSTRGRSGAHPLATMLGLDRSPSLVPVSVGRVYPTEQRRFAEDWFRAAAPSGGWRGGALLLDDTWTTGSRAQSVASALKMAGAPSVATVVLGRYVREEWPSAETLLDAARAAPFDIARCVICA